MYSDKNYLAIDIASTGEHIIAIGTYYVTNSFCDTRMFCCIPPDQKYNTYSDFWQDKNDLLTKIRESAIEAKTYTQKDMTEAFCVYLNSIEKSSQDDDKEQLIAIISDNPTFVVYEVNELLAKHCQRKSMRYSTSGKFREVIDTYNCLQLLPNSLQEKIHHELIKCIPNDYWPANDARYIYAQYKAGIEAIKLISFVLQDYEVTPLLSDLDTTTYFKIEAVHKQTPIVVEQKTNVAKELLSTAYYAASKHENQRQKNNTQTPYINHLLETANFLSSCGVNDLNVLKAALLHDIIEDQQVNYEELKTQFGEIVARIVLDCTDDVKLTSQEKKQKQIEHAKFACNETKLVKLADKYSNCKSLIENPPSTWSTEEITGYLYWAREVCKNCYGVNDMVDKRLKKLFISLSNDDLIIQTKLDCYYKCICNSD